MECGYTAHRPKIKVMKRAGYRIRTLFCPLCSENGLAVVCSIEKSVLIKKHYILIDVLQQGGGVV